MDKSIQKVLDNKDQLRDNDTIKGLVKELGPQLGNVSKEDAKQAIDGLNQKLKDAGSKTVFTIREDSNGGRIINARSEGERGPGTSADIPERKVEPRRKDDPVPSQIRMFLDRLKQRAGTRR